MNVNIDGLFQALSNEYSRQPPEPKFLQDEFEFMVWFQQVAFHRHNFVQEMVWIGMTENDAAFLTLSQGFKTQNIFRMYNDYPHYSPQLMNYLYQHQVKWESLKRQNAEKT